MDQKILLLRTPYRSGESEALELTRDALLCVEMSASAVAVSARETPGTFDLSQVGVQDPDDLTQAGEAGPNDFSLSRAALSKECRIMAVLDWGRSLLLMVMADPTTLLPFAFHSLRSPQIAPSM